MARRLRPLAPVLVLLLTLAVIVWKLQSPSAALVERVYARGLYPVLSSIIVPLTDLFPISLSGLLLVLLPFGLAFWLVRSWQHRRNVGRWLWNWLWRVVAGAVVVYALFILLWGANYRRMPVEALLDLPATPVTRVDVETLAEGLVAIIQRDAPAPAERDEAEALEALRSSLKAVVNRATGVSPTLPEGSKRLPPGMLLTFGNAGVISPWTLEPHVDGALTEPATLAVSAHELAHVAGFAGEADADLIAAIAGLQADDPYARYATALRLFSQLSWQLPPESYQAFYSQLPEVARADLTQMSKITRRYISPGAVEVVRTAYDQYLKGQGVEAGVEDYSRTITLLARAWRQGVVALGQAQSAAMRSASAE